MGATEGSQDRNFDAKGLSHLRVNLHQVQIEIRGWDKPDVAVHCDDPRIRMEMRDGVLAIDDRKLEPKPTGRLLVQLPPTVAVTLETISGDVKVHDLRSRATIESVSGEVDVGRIQGGLNLATVSGDISLAEL